MTIVKSIQQAIEYVETNLLDDLTIANIAKRAHMSPYHFQRTFSILTDMTVGEYIRRRRLTKAAQTLTDTDLKIIDIAYMYGYDTPESFAKAFRKQHGITPSEARKGVGKLQSYNRLSIQITLKGVEPMNYKIVEKDSFQIVGLKHMVPCDDQGGQSAKINELWLQAGQDGTLERLHTIHSGKSNGTLGVTTNFNEASNEIEYWIAIQSEHDASEPYGHYTVPKSKWAVFEVTGPYATALPDTMKKIYSEWFPSNQYEHSGAPTIEVYKTFNAMDTNAQSEIWIPIR